MFRQSPAGRNQRNQRIKVKHVVQICLLLGVCIWLLYQVQQSRNKNMRDATDNMKLGRKDIRPRTEKDTGAEKANEDDGNRPEQENDREEDSGDAAMKELGEAKGNEKSEENPDRESGRGEDTDRDSDETRGETRVEGNEESKTEESAEGNGKEGKSDEIAGENKNKGSNNEENTAENESKGEVRAEGNKSEELAHEKKSEKNIGGDEREENKNEETKGVETDAPQQSPTEEEASTNKSTKQKRQWEESNWKEAEGSKGHEESKEQKQKERSFEESGLSKVDIQGHRDEAEKEENGVQESVFGNRVQNHQMGAETDKVTLVDAHGEVRSNRQKQNEPDKNSDSTSDSVNGLENEQQFTNPNKGNAEDNTTSVVVEDHEDSGHSPDFSSRKMGIDEQHHHEVSDRHASDTTQGQNTTTDAMKEPAAPNNAGNENSYLHTAAGNVSAENKGSHDSQNIIVQSVAVEQYANAPEGAKYNSEGPASKPAEQQKYDKGTDGKTTSFNDNNGIDSSVSNLTV